MNALTRLHRNMQIALMLEDMAEDLDMITSVTSAGANKLYGYPELTPDEFNAFIEVVRDEIVRDIREVGRVRILAEEDERAMEKAADDDLLKAAEELGIDLSKPWKPVWDR